MVRVVGEGRGGAGWGGGGECANVLPLFFKKGHMSTLKEMSGRWGLMSYNQ